VPAPAVGARATGTSGARPAAADPLWRACFPSRTLELGRGSARRRCLERIDRISTATPTGAFDRVIIRDGSPADLQRLRCLRGVRELTIMGRRPGPLDPIAGLEGLERLTIEEFDLADLRWLASLHRLEYLWLGPLEYQRRRYGQPCRVWDHPHPLDHWNMEAFTKSRPRCHSLTELTRWLPALPRLDTLVLRGTAPLRWKDTIDLVGLDHQPKLRVLWVDASGGWLSLHGLERARVEDLTVVRARVPSLAPLIGKRPALRKLTLRRIGRGDTCSDFSMWDPARDTHCLNDEDLELDFGLGDLTELRYLHVSGMRLPELSFLRRLHGLEYFGNLWLRAGWGNAPIHEEDSRALRELLGHDHPCVLELRHAEYLGAEPGQDPFCNWRPVCTPIEAPACSKAPLSIGDLVRAYQRTCPARCAQGCRVIHDCPREARP